jgi:hypothetical protein
MANDIAIEKYPALLCFSQKSRTLNVLGTFIYPQGRFRFNGEIQRRQAEKHILTCHMNVHTPLF